MRSPKPDPTMLLAALVVLLPTALGAEEALFQARAVLEPTSVVDLRNEAGPSSVLSVAPEGKAVKKGTLLVELDPSALIARHTEARVIVEKAQAEVAVVEASLEAGKEASRAALEVAQLGLTVAEGAPPYGRGRKRRS